MEQVQEIQQEYSKRGVAALLPKKNSAGDRAKAVSSIVEALSGFNAGEYGRVLEAALLCLDDPDDSVQEIRARLEERRRDRDRAETEEPARWGRLWKS